MGTMTRRDFLACGATAGLAISVLSSCEIFSGHAKSAPAAVGEAAAIDNRSVGQFRRSLAGHLILPADSSYDSARRTFSWNPKTEKHPAMIVRCAASSDVARAIEFARTHNIEIAVRGGGHDVQ